MSNRIRCSECGRFVGKPKPFEQGKAYTLTCSKGHQIGYVQVPDDEIWIFHSLEDVESFDPVRIKRKPSTIQEAIDTINEETPSRKYKVKILPAGSLAVKKRRIARKEV